VRVNLASLSLNDKSEERVLLLTSLQLFCKQIKGDKSGYCFYAEVKNVSARPFGQTAVFTSTMRSPEGLP
jgi:hypothetical protein